MVVGAKVCELTDGLLWFVCGLYVGILTSPLETGNGFFLPYSYLHLYLISSCVKNAQRVLDVKGKFYKTQFRFFMCLLYLQFELRSIVSKAFHLCHQVLCMTHLTE